MNADLTRNKNSELQQQTQHRLGAANSLKKNKTKNKMKSTGCFIEKEMKKNSKGWGFCL